jgi:multidrug efflux pump subunit AcrB
VPSPVDIQIVGNDIDGERRYADEVLARLRHIPGIADPRIQQAFQGPTLNVALDRSMASTVGLTESAAATSMLDTLAGSTQTAPTYWLNPSTGVSYPVAIQTPQFAMNTMGDLKNLPLSAGTTTQLLGGLATVTLGPGAAVDTHYNTRPVIDIYATPQGRDLGAIAVDVDAVLRDTAHDLPRGASANLLGQVTTMTSAYQQLYFGLGFAVVLIYLLIVVNFQSWLDPFVIVMGLPAALAGIVWMLFLTNTTLSVPALTGAIMCMGVATANSILVISFARERLAAGRSAITAAMEAGSTRFRPVLMTALAMIIGMAPMALEPGQNAPLGRAVIGGLIFATCATLFFVPTVFSIVHARDHRKFSKPAPTSGVPTHA